MKLNLFVLLISLSLITKNYSQQTKTCDSPEETFEELNTISINKCTTESSESKKDDKKATRKFINNKKNNRIAHYVRKNPKSNSSKKQYVANKPQEILFSVVDKIPLFSKCRRTKTRQCFNNEFYKHFSENFISENASDDGVKSRLIIQFSINTKGDIYNISVKGNKKTNSLEKEIKRVVNKLPKFVPASHEGIPINVRHSLPLNFTF